MNGSEVYSGLCHTPYCPDAPKGIGDFFQMDSTDEKWMRRALELAAKGRGRTSPNPMVGAVVVKDGQVVGEGYHARAGEAHAEVNALRLAGQSAIGATLYITLEPCVHYGRTPPCVEAIREAKVGRLVVGTLDVNPLVEGQGVRRLEEDGVPVQVGVLEQECRLLNKAYITWMSERRPFVLLKVAASLDGKIATYRGHSRWLSCEASRRRVHAIRNEVDAVMVGAETVIRDDPELTIRLVEGEVRHPLRIVVDSTLRLPLSSRLLAEGPEVPTVVATTAKAPLERREAIEAMGRQVLVLPDREGRLDLSALMRHLAELQVVSLMLEGGAELNASMVEAGLVDEVLIILTPRLLGGSAAPTVMGGLGAATVEEGWSLKDLSVQQVGSDFHLSGVMERRL